MNANQYSYFMGGFMFFTIWMLIISYRGVPKVYLMRSIQVRTISSPGIGLCAV